MSASPVFSSAAMGRPFIFSALSSPHSTAAATAKKTAEILTHVSASSKLAAIVPASRLDVRPAPEMVSSGIPQLDALTGGLARGCLTEICGAASSGRTSVLLVALARATQRGEVCALVDTSDTFDPASAASAGMEMSRLLWVRCGERYSSRKPPSNAITGRARPHDSYRTIPSYLTENPERELCPQRLKSYSNQRSYRSSEPLRHPKSNASACLGLPQLSFSRWESRLGQMLKVTDLLLQSNGFGMIALDLGDVPVSSARRIPLASWFRFRRAVEHTPTALLVLEQQPIAGSCSSMLLKVSGKKLSAVSSQLSGKPLMHSGSAHAELPHAELLDQFEVTVELLRSRLERKSERKPVQSTASFNSRAAWAG
jgi:recombination protein RecA